MQDQNNTIRCKISFGNQLRRAPLSNLTFKDLEALIRQLFSLPFEKLSIQYKDEEEDLITFDTDIELQTAISSLPPNSLFRLIVTLLPQTSQCRSPPNVPLFPFPHHPGKFQCMKQHFKRIYMENPEQAKQIKEEFKKRKQAYKAQKRQDKADFECQYNATFTPECVIIPKEPSSVQLVSFTITNTGSATWPSGTSLVRVGKYKSNEEKIVLSASVAPGASVPLTMNVQVSDQACHFSKWRVMLPNQAKFGANFWIKTEHFSSFGPLCRFGSFQKNRFCEGILKLREMGFQGRKLWCLMRQYDGDVDRVVAALLSEKDSAEKA